MTGNDAASCDKLDCQVWHDETASARAAAAVSVSEGGELVAGVDGCTVDVGKAVGGAVVVAVATGVDVKVLVGDGIPGAVTLGDGAA